MSTDTLTDREILVLATIIDEYVSSATPVGSRAVSEASPLGLSPASMRATMANLTDKGFLEQPHTSAGRIPTPKAFRLYLDKLITDTPLSPDEQERILYSLSDSGLDISDMLRNASKLLSSLSRQASMVIAPLHSTVRWKRIDFALLQDNLVMTLLVLEGGIIQKKVIRLNCPITADDLNKYANYLNDLFTDKTVEEVRTHIMTELASVRRKLSDYFARALSMVHETVEENDDREIYLDGAAHMISQPEFVGNPGLSDLILIMEDKSRLLNLVDTVIDSGGVLISLPDPDNIPAMSELSLIASPYTVRGRVLGMVGVLGPIRMNYAGLLPMVRCTASSITEILEERF